MSGTSSYDSTKAPLTRQEVIDAARSVGALAVSWTTEPISSDIACLREWQRCGMQGEMRYMSRELSDTPAALVQSANTEFPLNLTVISLVFPYFPYLNSADSNPVKIGTRQNPVLGFGRIARYALGPDYHLVLPPRLAAFSETLKKRCGAGLWKSFTDAVPTLERAWARNGRLGFQGKNTMLIRPGVGSYFFISEVVTNAQIEGTGEAVRNDVGCGKCQRCAAACPTAALQTPHKLDARRCISYLTIEKRGILAEWERRALGNWIFGCDICQEVCPFNHHPADGLQDFKIAKLSEQMPIGTILNLKREADFLEFCGGTPLERTRRAGLLRNALCVAVNQGVADLLPQAMQLASEDPSPTIRATAFWSARQLAEGQLSCEKITSFLELGRKDPNPAVQQECAQMMLLL